MGFDRTQTERKNPEVDDAPTMTSPPVCPDYRIYVSPKTPRASLEVIKCL